MKKIVLIILILCAYTYASDNVSNAMVEYKNKHTHHQHNHQHKVNSNHLSYNMSNNSLTENQNKYENCFEKASLHYQVPSNLLKSIARVESKMNPDAIGVNHNGTYDVGIMQINSSWFPKLAKVGIQRGELLDGCKNIQVGAWILSQNIKHYGLSNDAIGRYNSSNPYYKNLYAYKVLKNYKENS